MSASVKPLLLRDEIHGDMSFSGVLRHVIDHPSFQRLRYIKQLGLAEYVFPCATHTRFQHSLGACFLAGQYFDHILESWLTKPFLYTGVSETTRFYGPQTLSALKAVAQNEASRKYWRSAVSLAALLHDVGHGPWSHTFEGLAFRQDYSAITREVPGAFGQYFRKLEEQGVRFKHEDVSVLFIFQILRDLEKKKLEPDALAFFPTVASLVNNKIVRGQFSAVVETEIEQSLLARGIQGGVEVHHLFQPVISGPFDVDRMDYIQRDGRNCGVSMGGIEWRRIVTKLLPCLANHENDRREPGDVVLISDLKNQHVLDDFIFSLFQMYAQVYMHPKIVGLEENIRRLLSKALGPDPKLTVTFALHETLSDYGFRRLMVEELGIKALHHLLSRSEGSRFKVVSLPQDDEQEAELKKKGFELIDEEDRPMLKDSMGVFLSHYFPDQKDQYFVRPWSVTSPIAQHFHSLAHAPRIWMRSEGSP